MTRLVVRRRARLVDALVECSTLKKDRLEQLIEAGHVFAGGKRSRNADAIVDAGTRVVVHDKPTETLIPLAILHEDDDLIVVNKALGDHLNETETSSRLSIVERILGAYVVHRLDRETSGVVVLAKNAAVAERLSQAFRTRRVAKSYLALVDGDVTDGLIDAPIAKDPRRPRARRVHSSGKAAQTRVSLLAQSGGVSAVRAEPKTGRTHQIRVHLSHIGAPILGDVLYGGPTAVRLNKEIVRCERVLLHAATLSFEWNGRSQSFRAPLPQDLLEFEARGLALSRVFA